MRTTREFWTTDLLVNSIEQIREKLKLNRFPTLKEVKGCGTIQASDQNGPIELVGSQVASRIVKAGGCRWMAAQLGMEYIDEYEKNGGYKRVYGRMKEANYGSTKG